MKKLKNEKGAITILVLVSILFMVSFLISTYAIVANKVKSQKEMISQIRETYENRSTMQEIYDSYFISDEVIPVYTAKQFNKIGTGENIYVEEKGKIYQFNSDAHYLLMNDINFANNEEFSIIGGSYIYTDESQTVKFSGILDGLGHTIKGITTEDQAIIGYNTGIIKNIIIEDININSENYLYSAFIAKNDGKVQNISIKESVIINATTEGTAGIVGYNTETIENCSNSGKINGVKHVGGIVGYNTKTIENCSNNGEIIGNVRTAGICGNLSEGFIKNCTNSGKITGATEYTGGIVGENYAVVQDCSNSGEIIGNARTGGIVGQSRSIIQNCNNTGTITGNTATGGITGWNYNVAEITNSYNNGEVKASGIRMGGIAGINLGSIVQSYNIGTISAEKSTNRIGGIAGANQLNSGGIGTIKKCYNTGRIEAVEGCYRIGGIAGENISGAFIEETYNTADIMLVDVSYAGGISGYVSGIISYVYNKGNIICDGPKGKFIGGIGGYITISGSLENAYNIGQVKGSERVGGIVGLNNKDVNNCYNFGEVGIMETTEITENKYCGGVIGWNAGNINNCYNKGNIKEASIDEIYSYYGGISGRNLANISNCYNYGEVGTQIVEAKSFTGGIVGRNGTVSEEEEVNVGYINTCYNYANVYGEKRGAIVGNNVNGNITNCWYLTSIDVGGINGEDVVGQAEPTDNMPPFPEIMQIINGTNTDENGNEYTVFVQNSGEYPKFTWQQ